MRLNDLLKESKPVIAKYETTCEYLTQCGIPFVKNRRADGTGADFLLKNLAIAKDVFKRVTNDRVLTKSFDFELDTSNKTVKVYFK
jgi:hypothetical protein